jgi:RNase H-fold protein (predicted Holliday junction resolvase)
LNELYSCQEIELNDLFARYRHYCKSKIDEITSLVLKAQLGRGYNGNLNSIVVKAYTHRIKNIILGKPLNVRDKQYPLRKFKEDIIEQLDITHKVMGK